MTLESISRLVLFLGGLVFFLIFELLAPYRPSSVSKLGRWINNLYLATLNGFLLYLIFSKPTYRTSLYVINNSLGLLNMTDLSYWIKVLIAIMSLDLEIYIWHLLNHEIPLLWRFHRVHHSDLNLDVSTASRFHIIELGISAIIKIALIFFLGIDLFMIVIFESAVVLTSQFHHSSLKLPKWFEEIWWTLFVPPSMHRIHHSVIIRERNSNYGVIFSIWDRILGTLIRKADQRKILIGMGAYRRIERLNFYHLMKMPFTRSVR